MMRKQFMKTDWCSLSPGQTVSMCVTVESLFSSLINLSLLFSTSHFLSPSFLSFHPYPGGSDGWYHHGNGSGPAWTTLLPAGRLREVQSSGWCQGMLRLRSACRGDLVGTEGKTQREVNMWAVSGPHGNTSTYVFIFYKLISYFAVLLLKVLSSPNE